MIFGSILHHVLVIDQIAISDSRFHTHALVHRIAARLRQWVFPKTVPWVPRRIFVFFGARGAQVAMGDLLPNLKTGSVFFKRNIGYIRHHTARNLHGDWTDHTSAEWWYERWLAIISPCSCNHLDIHHWNLDICTGCLDQRGLAKLVISGWWFGTFGLLFPDIGNNHPNWLSYFSEG